MIYQLYWGRNSDDYWEGCPHSMYYSTRELAEENKQRLLNEKVTNEDTAIAKTSEGESHVYIREIVLDLSV